MEQMRRNGHRYGALIVALALLLALAGLAYAATQSGILDRLFGGAPPPQVVERAIIRNPASASDQGITLTIDEYLYTNSTLDLGWTVTSVRDEPVYYLVEQAKSEPPPSEGQSGSSSSSGTSSSRSGLFTVLDGADGRPGVGRSRSDYTRESAFGGERTEPFQVSITVHAYASPLTPVLLTDDDEDNALLHQLAGERKLGVVDGCVSLIPFEESRLATYIQPPEGSLQPLFRDFSTTGLMNPITTLTVTVTVDPVRDDAFWHTEPVQRSINYPGGRIEIDTLDFSAASSRMTGRLYPDGPVGEPDIERKRYCQFLDESGNPIFLVTGTGYSGGDHYDVGADGNPLLEPPESVYLLPEVDVAVYDAAVERGTVMELHMIRIDLVVTE